FLFFFSLIRPPLISTLFPYTTLFRSLLAKCRRKSFQFDWIAQAGACPMGFNITDGFRINLVLGINRTLQLDLAVDTRRRYSVCPDRKSTRLNSSHVAISYAVFCLKKK